MAHSFKLPVGIRTQSILGIVLMLLGGSTTSGWLLHIPAMVEIKHGLVPMVFNTGLCFFLSGIALAVSGSRAPFWKSCRRAIGWVLVGLCTATVLEHVLDKNFGIDFAFLHTWYDYGNTRPGRMAPNTALGFVLIGSVHLLCLEVRSKPRAAWTIILTFMALAIGLTGLVGYLLAPDLLFGWARSARMALHTALGMITSAIGLWTLWSKSDWYRSEAYFREDVKIRFLGAAIVIVLSTTAGLTGFVLLQGSLEQALASRLQGIIFSRSPWFNLVAEEVGAHAIASIRLSKIDADASALLADNVTSSAAGKFERAGSQLLGDGYVGLLLEDPAGRPVKAIGTINPEAVIAAPLDKEASKTLVWDKQILFRIRYPLSKEGRRLGTLILDTPVPALDKSLTGMPGLGETAELAICVLRQQRLACLPNTKNDQPFFVETRARTGVPLPMERALSGATGITYAVDYRGHNVIAAYGLLAPGLGVVAKQDTMEAYGAIRQSLAIGAPIIIIVSLFGALVLYSQLNPLAARMRSSELKASNAAAKIKTIMDAAGDGIITIDHRGLIQSVNREACHIFGHTDEELIGQNVTILMPSQMRHAHEEGLARVTAGGEPHVLGTSNIQLLGQRRDGTQFPLELTINAVPVPGQHLFVGVMRDITVRKEMEEKLSRMAQFDALTALPNRALFMDRLASALVRSKRSKAAFALMFLDLDGFKSINDTFGHQGGDMLLVQVANRLAAAVRKSDTVARLAGDEFTIILEELADPVADANRLAKKIVDTMRTPFIIEGHQMHVTASVGMVLHHPGGDDIELDELLRRADEKMYAVKQAGKNDFSLA